MRQALAAVVVLAATASAAGAPPAVEVRTAGEMRRVMRDGDLRATIDLRTLAGTKHLYALGPLAGLRGEVTVWDGKPSIARVREGAIETSESFEVEAAFLVYAEIEAWQEVPIPADVRDARQLEAFVAGAAGEQGLDVNAAFPFGVEATSSTARFHVVNKTDDSPSTPETHEAVKLHFGVENAALRLLGFYSDHHHGVFTHHDSNIHVHVIAVDGAQSGHLESLQLGPGAKLFLPRP